MKGDDLYEDLRKKYLERLRTNLSERDPAPRTRQYQEFRKEYLPKPLSWYEKVCAFSLSIITVSPDQKKRASVERDIATSHLQVTPEGVASFAIVAPLFLILTSVLLFLIIPMVLGYAGSLFVTVYVSIVALILVFPLGNIPRYFAAFWRMRTSNEMVLSIFYIVTYMRHTSNLELAIDFASEHLSGPLSLDLNKVIWDLETQRYDSLKESLEAYLETWRGQNDEYIEAMHLVESSLVETAESRRVEALDKALSVMLEETYEKMLHYAHDLKGPLTTLHMLGIILPILGLVILPLLVAFEPRIKWYHLFLLYNVTLPVLVFFLGRGMLSKRPSGYGSSDEEDVVPTGKKPLFTPLAAAVFTLGLLVLIGILPLLVHVANPDFDLVIRSGSNDCTLGLCPVDVNDKKQMEGAVFRFLEYREIRLPDESVIVAGPFGLFATLFSILLPLGLGLSVGLYYRLRNSGSVERRKAAKKLELEFASALFQLGNRLADGLPLEIAFSKVALVLPETISGKFFNQVSANITRLGLSVEDAIFHERYGALREYPSDMIESSMKVLVESSRKGPLIASQAIINVSNYIKEMHRVDERLKDLMADVISSMQSQIKFLTPTIAGIVIGIAAMITAILGKLGGKVDDLASQTGGAGATGIGVGLLDMFRGGGIPTYYFQFIVGLYVVQIVYVLTILVNGIENGSDKTGEECALGQNMVKSTVTYCAIAFAVILLFNIVAANIVPE